MRKVEFVQETTVGSITHPVGAMLDVEDRLFNKLIARGAAKEVKIEIATGSVDAAARAALAATASVEDTHPNPNAAKGSGGRKGGFFNRSRKG
jgi:hypothetical protein